MMQTFLSPGKKGNLDRTEIWFKGWPVSAVGFPDPLWHVCLGPLSASETAWVADSSVGLQGGTEMSHGGPLWAGWQSRTQKKHVLPTDLLSILIKISQQAQIPTTGHAECRVYVFPLLSSSVAFYCFSYLDARLSPRHKTSFPSRISRKHSCLPRGRFNVIQTKFWGYFSQFRKNCVLGNPNGKRQKKKKVVDFWGVFLILVVYVS